MQDASIKKLTQEKKTACQRFFLLGHISCPKRFINFHSFLRLNPTLANLQPMKPLKPLFPSSTRGINGSSKEDRIHKQFAATQPECTEIGIISYTDHTSSTNGIDYHGS